MKGELGVPGNDSSGRTFPDEAHRGAEIIGWDSYCRGRPIFDQLTDIRGFNLLFDIPPIPELSSRDFAANLSTRMYRHVRDAVSSAKFYAVDELKLSASTNAATVNYDDDRYDFGVRIKDGTIAVVRGGSRFSDFHKFYSSLFLHMPQLMNESRREIAEVTGRECIFMRGAYVFEFLIHDIRPRGSDRSVRNSEVIGRLINGIPGDNGALSNEVGVLNTAGRIDINISRWVKTQSGMRICRYTIEAPANKEGAAVWFKFSYGGETYSNPDRDQERTPFEPEHFLDESDRAYVKFLRDTAIDGFLESLLKEYSFKTSAYQLP